MLNRRQRTFIIAASALLAIWMAAWGGFQIARHSQVTAEKVGTYLRSIDLDQLSAQARAKALRDLARMLNALPYEERRAARLDDEWSRWFKAMTEQEKSSFIEATMPAGFRQMIAAFEELPEAKRRRTIDQALKRMKEAPAKGGNGPGLAETGAQRPEPLSEELRQKVATIGLESFYRDSSAQTKADLAPLIEELQRSMQSGAAFRGR